MPENQERKPTAEVQQSVTVIIEHKKVHKRKNSDRNYPLLQRGKEIIERNYRGIKTIINRNYRRLSY